MIENHSHFFVDADKTNPSTLNIRATGGTCHLKYELEARGFAWDSREIKAAEKELTAEYKFLGLARTL